MMQTRSLTKPTSTSTCVNVREKEGLCSSREFKTNPPDGKIIQHGKQTAHRKHNDQKG